MIASNDLHCLINPSVVAVVGASERPGSLGFYVLDNLQRGGFSGQLVAVNPKYDEVLGVRSYPALADVPHKVDCAILCVPAKAITEVLAQAAQAGARAAIVFASGFAEAGEEGKALQGELRQTALLHGLQVCGPNCLGVMNLRDHFVGFSASMPEGLACGNVAAVCQSGSVSIALLNSGRDLAFSYVVSSGNEAVTTIEDYLQFFVEDDATKVVLAFIEGFRNVEKLRRVAKRALELDKPIIALKVGRSAVGKRTVVAHTGALAGSDAVQDAFFKQAGIVRVADLDEMLETATLFLKSARPRGPKIGAIAISGGEVSLVADMAEQVGLEFAELSSETVSSIKELLPPFSNVGNPLDAWGMGDLGETYAACLERMGNDPGVDLITVCQDAQAGLGKEQAAFYENLAHSVLRIHKRLTKPLVLFSNISGGFHPVLRKVLDGGDIPTLQGTEESLRAVRHLIDFSSMRALQKPAAALEVDKQRAARARRILGADILSEHESKQLLSLYGIPCVRGKIAGDLDQALAAGEEIGFPVALKVNSPDIQHKTDAGAVRLNITDSDALAKAYQEILANAGKALPAARIQGVLVQEMLDLRQAIEVIVGVARDPQFGPTILFGLGGVQVEALKDVALRVAPIDEQGAWSMLEEIRAAPILKGFRGKPPADAQAIVDVLMKLSQLCLELEELVAEIDINPLVVFPEEGGALAADALIVRTDGDAAGKARRWM